MSCAENTAAALPLCSRWEIILSCVVQTLVKDFSINNMAPQDRDTHCTYLEALGHRIRSCRAHGSAELLAHAVEGGLVVCGWTVKKACVVEPNRTILLFRSRMTACTHTNGPAGDKLPTTEPLSNPPCLRGFHAPFYAGHSTWKTRRVSVVGICRVTRVQSLCARHVATQQRTARNRTPR